MKAQYERSVHPHTFNEGDLFLNYDQKHDKLGSRNLESMWHAPYILSHFLEKGVYDLIDYDGIPLGETRNEIYLKILCQ